MSESSTNEENQRAGLEALGRRPRRSRLPKASELAARDLATYIVDSELAEGTPLPTEKAMAESLGVGRTTMREALRLLETRGVLTIRSGPSGGPVVRRPRPADLRGALTLMLQFNSASFGEVMAARGLLEPVVAAEAAGRISAEGLQELREINGQLVAAGGRPDLFAELNGRFHSLIGEHSGNKLMQIFADSMLETADSRSVEIIFDREQVEAIVVAHAAIIVALESGDPIDAATTMKAHLEESDRFLRRVHRERMRRKVVWEL
jgi:DNA-binding FadR family transcriptional regulator